MRIQIQNRIFRCNFEHEFSFLCMKISRNINYLLMAIGAIIALYAQNQENQNEALMIGGIVLLIIGVYRISKNIPSKNDDYDDQNNVEL